MCSLMVKKVNHSINQSINTCFLVSFSLSSRLCFLETGEMKISVGARGLIIMLVTQQTMSARLTTQCTLGMFTSCSAKMSLLFRGFYKPQFAICSEALLIIGVLVLKK